MGHYQDSVWPHLFNCGWAGRTLARKRQRTLNGPLFKNKWMPCCSLRFTQMPWQRGPEPFFHATLTERALTLTACPAVCSFVVYRAKCIYSGGIVVLKGYQRDTLTMQVGHGEVLSHACFPHGRGAFYHTHIYAWGDIPRDEAAHGKGG